MKAQQLDSQESFEERRQEIYDFAIEFWNSLSSTSANKWMGAYDHVFKIVLHDTLECGNSKFSNCQAIYDVYKQILEEEIEKFDTKEGYIQKVEYFTRSAAYLHRFFVPNNKLTPLGEVAKNLVEISFN